MQIDLKWLPGWHRAMLDLPVSPYVQQTHWSDPMYNKYRRIVPGWILSLEIALGRPETSVLKGLHARAATMAKGFRRKIKMAPRLPARDSHRYQG